MRCCLRARLVSNPVQLSPQRFYERNVQVNAHCNRTSRSGDMACRWSIYAVSAPIGVSLYSVAKDDAAISPRILNRIHARRYHVVEHFQTNHSSPSSRQPALPFRRYGLPVVHLGCISSNRLGFLVFSSLNSVEYSWRYGRVIHSNRVGK